jgi:hypothetical protein
MTSKSQNQDTKPKVDLVDRILNKPWKKVVVALTLTLVVVGGVGFAYIWYTPSLRSQFFDRNTQQLEARSYLQLSETDKKLLEYNPVSLLIQKKTVKDMPIYPKSWQKNNFSESELGDQSKSGQAADFDNDGLSNKEEYVYGSNPKNRDTLGAGGTDGEYVKAGNSPLSGMTLESAFDFSYFLLNTDVAILESLNDDLDVLEDEGISVPVLYERSRTEDYSIETNGINMNVIQNPTREGSISYLNERLLVLKETASSKYFSTLSTIYQIKDVETLKILKSDNNGRIISFRSMGVPAQEVEIHKNLLYFFMQIDKLIDLRIEVVENGLERSQYDARQQEIVKRSVWAYRKINDAVNQLNPNK